MRKVGRKNSVDIKKKTIRDQVEIFGKVLATHEEMASYFNCCVRTIERYMHIEIAEDGSEKISEFCRVYKTAASTTKLSLRRKQLQKATKGDNAMLIWLGKQLLGQKESSESKNISEVKNTVILEEQDKETDLSNLSDEELVQYANISEKLAQGAPESNK